MTTTHKQIRRFALILLNILFVSLFLFRSDALAQCGPMDVVFVVDDTGSMGGALNSIKSDLTSILNNIETASKNDYRLALVTFKNDVTIRENFSDNNRASIAAKILALTADGGGAIPEASDEALNTVVNALSANGRNQNIDFTPNFRPRTFKLIILITDAVPGGFDDKYTPGIDDKHAHDVAVQAAANGIKISAIYVPTFASDTALIKPIMQDYANTTAGFYIETAQDGSGTAAAIKSVIAGCGSTATVPVSVPTFPTDDKAGSVLFYNIYTSDSAAPQLENTLISITNTDENKAVTVRVFFVDGETGNVADSFFCILPTRHINLYAADYDPGIKGYAIAVAVDNTGCPINFNRLIGGEVVKFKSGHQAALNAISFAAVAQTPVVCDPLDYSATMYFDGISYDFSPRVLSVDNIPSSLDGNQTMLVVNRFGGDLTKTAPIGIIGNMSAVLFNDVEKPINVLLAGGTSQQRNILRDGYPRSLPAFTKIIASGHTGWLRFISADGNSVVGAALSLNSKTNQNGGHNLRQLAMMDRGSFLISITPPGFTCQ